MAQSRVSVCDLIGTPFDYGGRGPDAYDCYGLLMELMKKDGITIADFRSTDNISVIAKMMGENIYLWRRCEKKPGCGILFRIKGLGAHVGYLLDDGTSFVHTWEGSGGVLIESLADWEHRIMGFYEYVG